MADLQKLQFNNRTILTPSRDSFVAFQEPPTYKVTYSNKNTINNTYAQANVPWSSYPVILLQRDWQYSGSNGEMSIANSSGGWLFHVRKYNSYINSSKYGIERGTWGANGTADNSGVSTTTFWSANWFVIPVNPSSYITEKIIVDTANNVMYYYANGTKMCHFTNFTYRNTPIQFKSSTRGLYMKNMYVVGCSDIATAVSFTGT